MLHRAMVAAIRPMPGPLPAHWKRRALNLIGFHSIRLAYVRCQSGCGNYFTHLLILGLGCVRAVMLSDWKAAVWVTRDASGASETYPVLLVLGTDFCVETAQIGVVLMMRRLGLISYPFREELEDHPLGSAARRHFDAKCYVFAFCANCSVVVICMLVFMGPLFVFGVCAQRDADSSFIALASLDGSRFRCVGSP
jgi:hypothetical protein